MSGRLTVVRLATAREAAAGGVDYSPRSGASCPWCGKKTRIYRTLPWDGRLRVRYHRCYQRGCPIASMGVSIKSIEVDPVAVARTEEV